MAARPAVAIAVVAVFASNATAQRSRVEIEPFVAVQLVPEDQPSTYIDQCPTSWKQLGSRVGARLTVAPVRRVSRLVVDATLAVTVTRPFDCASIPRRTVPSPGAPLEYTLQSLGDGTGGLGLLRVGYRVVDSRRVAVAAGVGIGAASRTSPPIGTAGAHATLGGGALRATIGIDWLTTRVQVRTETFVPNDPRSNVRVVDAPYTFHAKFVRVGLTWQVP
jgi:hypothetical protein